jgi:hypothetical protein
MLGNTELAPVYNSESYRIAYDYYKSKCKSTSSDDLISWQKHEQYQLVVETVNLIQKARLKQQRPVRNLLQESQVNEFKLKMTALIHHFNERLLVLREEEQFVQEQRDQDLLFLDDMRQKVRGGNIQRPQLYVEMNTYTAKNSVPPTPTERPPPPALDTWTRNSYQPTQPMRQGVPNGRNNYSANDDEASGILEYSKQTARRAAELRNQDREVIASQLMRL